MECIMKYSKEAVVQFTGTLSTTEPDKFTEQDILKISTFIGSDGCTLVLDICKEACIEHDFYYATKMDFTGKPISRTMADRLFKEASRKCSALGKASPMSVWRWLGVRAIGWIFWRSK